MEKSFLILFLLLLGCSSQPKTVNQGNIQLGPDGKIVGGKIKVACTQPEKTYTRDVIVNVKASLDSISRLKKSNLEAGIRKEVVKLTQYTSEGLDRSLLLFRICQMANNRSLNEEQINRLIDIAKLTFDETIKKKNQQ